MKCKDCNKKIKCKPTVIITSEKEFIVCKKCKVKYLIEKIKERNRRYSILNAILLQSKNTKEKTDGRK